MRIVCSGLIALFALCFSSAHAQVEAENAAPQWSLAIHGGAGVIERSSLTPEQDAAYRAALRQLWPERRIEVAVLWTATRSVMGLPDAVLDGVMAGLDPAGSGT